MRRCSHCSQDVNPLGVQPHGIESIVAWLSGYCTPMCQRNAALKVVAEGNAWWQRGDK